MITCQTILKVLTSIMLFLLMNATLSYFITFKIPVRYWVCLQFKLITQPLKPKLKIQRPINCSRFGREDKQTTGRFTVRKVDFSVLCPLPPTCGGRADTLRGNPEKAWKINVVKMNQVILLTKSLNFQLCQNNNSRGPQSMTQRQDQLHKRLHEHQ